MSLVPYVIEQTSRGERNYDIYSRLLKDNRKSCCCTASVSGIGRSKQGYSVIYQFSGWNGYCRYGNL